MLKRAPITLVLLLVALANNGTRPASASGVSRQDFRPIPSVPGNSDYSACSCPAEPGDEVREEFHQTYPLSPTGRVSLENLNGGVQIKVWDRPAVQLDAIKRAYRKERLAEARIEVRSTEENIRIKTEYPDESQSFRGDERRYDNPAIVDYTLTVPRKAVLESIELVNGSLDIDGAEGSVKASSINGRVAARGLLGETKLSTINGPLQASFAQLDESKPISLGSVNGSVTLIIPSDSNASIRAGTVHGDISNDFGMQVRHGEYVGHNLDGQIGTGGPRIKLANVNGPIRITHAEDGRTLSPATSIIIDKEKLRDEAGQAMEGDVTRAVEQATAAVVAAESTRAARADAVRITRQAQREAQRQVDVALREAQREIQRAQIEVQRETQRQMREQIRIANAYKGRGVSVASGTGVGTGSGYTRYTTQETKSFSVTVSPRVNIRTFDGRVAVHGWDKSEVMYTATKRADDEESLKQIVIETEQQGNAVSVAAVNDNERNGSVELEVYVPRNATLHVSSDDGQLTLEGVSGDITLRTGDGGIEVKDGGGQLQVNTGDGRIQVSRFEGQVDARTGDGEISLDGNFNGLSARTGDGTISLIVPAGSNFTIETNEPNEVSSEGFNVAEDITPSRRMKRWRVGNGGKVFILKTGDGKILLRSR